MKIRTVKLNPVTISKEQKQALKRNIFISEYEKFFKHVDRYSLNSNIYFFGKLVNRFGSKSFEEDELKAILCGINKLKANKPPIKKISLINVIYSTIIKRIRPEDIISGSIKAETYRKIIDDSIKMYRTHPIGKGIDYRHILGRMVSLKNMSSAIQEKLKYMPQEFSPLEWTQNEQVELVCTLERIYSQYKKINADFVEKKYKNKHPQRRADTTFESVENNYLNSIVKLLWMIKDSVFIMLRNARLNFNNIKDSINLAFYYSGKLSYDDTKRMPKVNGIIAKLKEAEKLLKKIKTKENR